MRRALGCFEFIDHSEGRLIVTGWLTHPDVRVDAVRVEVNGQDVGPAVSVERNDVSDWFAWHDRDRSAGFHAETPCPREPLEEWFRVRVVGQRDGQDALWLEIMFVLDLSAGLALPSAAMRQRICGSEGEPYFVVSGAAAVGDFFTALEPHTPISAVKSLLDWGCGCGRIAQIVRKYHPDLALSGCDIDAEAIEWCSTNLAPARFEAVAPEPPTPFDDSSMDVILGYSVCTHLSRGDQFAWLDELRRITTPGGTLLLSVHGPFAARTCTNPPEVKARIKADLERDGISDDVLDVNLGEIAPEGYYRGTFQTEEYVRREWCRGLEVIDYIEQGMGNYQDLVVLRKPSA